MVEWIPAALACLALAACIGSDARSESDLALGAGPAPAPVETPPPAAPEGDDSGDDSGGVLDGKQRPILREWFEAVGERRADETFGELIVRAGRHQLGRAYRDTPQPGDVERLHIELETLQCVSFVESSLALARCTWADDRDEACFLREVRRSRYRDGIVDGYGSRLHYFTDWIADNVLRKRLTDLSSALGGVDVPQIVNYMSRHPQRYPGLDTAEERAAIAAAEARLSARPVPVIGRDAVKAAEPHLQAGDVIAIMGSKPGLPVSHVGVIDLGDGTPRILHASSYHKKVMLSSSIAQYIQRREQRRGILVARPTVPSPIGPGAAR